jgi:hypothetical protein
MKLPNKFRDVALGQWFDFIGPDRMNSFYLRCRKTGLNAYVDEFGNQHRVGCRSCNVYHISDRKGASA